MNTLDYIPRKKVNFIAKLRPINNPGIYDPNNGWDGNLKGQKCNPAVYVYWTEIELFDGTRMTLKGDVTLMR